MKDATSNRLRMIHWQWLSVLLEYLFDFFIGVSLCRFLLLFFCHKTKVVLANILFCCKTTMWWNSLPSILFTQSGDCYILFMDIWLCLLWCHACILNAGFCCCNCIVYVYTMWCTIVYVSLCQGRTTMADWWTLNNLKK